MTRAKGVGPSSRAVVAMALAGVFMAACGSSAPSSPPGGGPVGEVGPPDFVNPLHGNPLPGMVEAADGVGFPVLAPPGEWGTASWSMSPSGSGIAPNTVKVAAVFSGTKYGVLDLIQGVPQEANWNDFISGVVAAGKEPGTVGSSEVGQLADGSSALITTTGDGTRSDIQWQNRKGTVEYAIQGETTDRVAVIALANQLVGLPAYASAGSPGSTATG